ncbi:PKD domain-containing protein [Streptomyces sp. S.PB5]|uniref:fibronectin type III domain-containing protein n=1 Tax=Streptomyces sp. S.PB5 TaxID=3020844 RepID=UPI0025B08B57|nr:PKD domain-containing protein [Streptomyces sp. S.PB5]MDN3023981.1 PKD domain-containing protein [Streptomyces sp. S.PB5]
MRPHSPAESTKGVGRQVRRRCAELATGVWAKVRPTRDRVTGYLAIGAVGALIGTSLAVGGGASGTAPELADIGAWLSTSERGEVAHVHGLTGDVDGRVVLPSGTEGHPVSVARDGDTTLVLDESTGTVVRLDPSQLTAEQSTDHGESGLRLLSGGSRAYVVDPARATVQQIDPVLTTPRGPAVRLDGEPGAAVVDRAGTLWVPLPGKGTVVPFVEGRRHPAVRVAEAGHDLALTLADGLPVVTDRTAATVQVLTADGVRQTFELGATVEDSDDVLVPTATDGSTVPVLAADTGVLVLLDVRGGHVVNARLPLDGTAAGAPQVLGKRVYVPDESTGRLLTYDTSTASTAEPVQITQGAGELELFVRDGLLWANDEDSAAAAVIDTSGKVTPIIKYEEDAPSSGTPGAHEPGDGPDSGSGVPPGATPSAGDPGAPGVGPSPGTTPGPGTGTGPGPGTTRPGPGPDPTPDCDAEWKPGCPEPGAPGTPQAQSGAGVIRITFAAASGATPRRYVLQEPASDQIVTPDSVGPDGPFEFEVRGGSCDQQYSFTVVAEYAGGAPSKSSAPSAPARPCLVPGAPEQLTMTLAPGGHGATVTWQPPQGADAGVTYTIDGPGGTERTTETTHVYTGLENNKQYEVSVAASNAAGSGTPAKGTLDLTPPDKVKNIVHNDNDEDDLYIVSNPNPVPVQDRVGSIPGMSSPEVTVHCKAQGKTVTHSYTGVTSNVWGKITYRNNAGDVIKGYVADIYLDSRLDPDIWDCT